MAVGVVVSADPVQVSRGGRTTITLDVTGLPVAGEATLEFTITLASGDTGRGSTTVAISGDSVESYRGTVVAGGGTLVQTDVPNVFTYTAPAE